MKKELKNNVLIIFTLVLIASIRVFLLASSVNAKLLISESVVETQLYETELYGFNGEEIDLEKYEIIWNDIYNIIIRVKDEYSAEVGEVDCSQCPEGFASTKKAYHVLYDAGEFKVNADLSGAIPRFCLVCPRIESIENNVLVVRTENKCCAASEASTAAYYYRYDLSTLDNNHRPELEEVLVTFTQERFIMVGLIGFLSGIVSIICLVCYLLVLIIKKDKISSHWSTIRAFIFISIISAGIFFSPYLLDEQIKFKIKDNSKPNSLDCELTCLG